MRPFLAFFVFALAFALVSGCAKDKLVGDWEFSQGAMTGTMTFNADRTFRQQMNVMGQTITFTGSYKLEGNMLKTTLAGADMGSMDANMKKMLEAFTEKQKGVEQSGEVTWNGNDEFTASFAGQSVTMTRKK